MWNTAAAGKRVSHVNRVMKQLVLDVAELHDVYQQVPAGRTAFVQHSISVYQPQSSSRQS